MKCYNLSKGRYTGLGFHKDPKAWGAFPTDAYSHTPFQGGAKQPGMTGQVKEEIITRWTELGLSVWDGKIRFDGTLVDESEFLKEKTEFELIRIDGSKQRMCLDPNSLAFTFCQTPIVYVKNGLGFIDVERKDGNHVKLEGNTLPQDWSQSVFSRENRIKRITVNL